MKSTPRLAFHGAMYATLILFLGLGGWGYYSQYTVLQCKSSFQYINSSIPCENLDQVIDKSGYAKLRAEIESYVDEVKKTGSVEDVSVYFRDLNNGPVMGIDETADFSPASLMKLPLVFLYFDMDESNPGLLKELPKLEYRLPVADVVGENSSAPLSSVDFLQDFPPPNEIEQGVKYGVEDLLFRVLAYSDNKANELLIRYAIRISGNDNIFSELYQNLGLVGPENPEQETVTVRGYSALFRLLYQSAYLNPENSEKILSWLSQSSFDQGIEAGVPGDVRVAHKFGEREVGDSVKVRQLHDCGIVYYPNNPYLLCIMTKGSDAFDLPGVIQKISAMVYNEVDSRRLK